MLERAWFNLSHVGLSLLRLQTVSKQNDQVHVELQVLT